MFDIDIKRTLHGKEITHANGVKQTITKKTLRYFIDTNVERIAELQAENIALRADINEITLAGG